MARSFYSTLGSGTTDQVNTGVTTAPTQLTIALQYYINSAGGGSAGRLYDKSGNTVTNNEYLFFNTSTLNMRKSFGTIAGTLMDASIPQTADATWHGLVITYDRTSISNNPIFYKDGAVPTITKSTTGSGNTTVTTNPYVFGNNGGGARGFDGMLANIALWDRLLTANEALPISNGHSPLSASRGLFYFAEGIQTWQDLIGGVAPTITGTAVQPHPRTIGVYA